MIECNIIERTLLSRRNSAIVVIKKIDGSHRFCCDFRNLYKITIPIAYRMPNMEEIFSLHDRGKYFTTLDARSGYWCIPINNESKVKTVFSSSFGKYQFRRLAFGLSNAPAAFVALMDQVLQGLDHFALGYVDILVHTKTNLQDHLMHIQKVFERLRDHKAELNISKCNFAQAEINYLGQTINQRGIAPNYDKVKVIQEIEPTKTVK